MPLNASGPISLGGSTSGQSVNLELGQSATAQISFNDANVRTLTATSAGTALIMPTNFWGKGGGFTPVTRTYTSGTGATETVPTGATSVTITVDGGGGSGGYNSSALGGGGGGGGRSVLTIAVTGGNTFTYTVGSSVAGRATNGAGTTGNASSVTGTPSGGSVSMTANGGAGGQVNNGGAGGTATGGTTNTSGSAGDAGIADGAGGNGAGGGAGGSYLGTINGSPPGGGGGGSGVDAGSVTSGSGARGQISFAYT